ncbi:ATP-binding cassette subfamily C protein/competence factor transporting protein [Weissella uvarum]|uniref:peptide cleavage/export ABC transporter n=1 Tax=Weissella uvarum TaxID=1479233 RepID=UPI0019621FB2|nr:peptide cleavage/export ABC transporter [Weissella uvarum]MBM7616932.1 ATP-binding cassette subfamily C protein/competence factor transporting protein [Weissella uvarum]MCM0594617.1 peptide cleavage/export ABC transporter [Weissella uvarum]
MQFKYISQVDERDCGAACLAMITKSYNHNVSISTIRDLEKTDLNGSTALGIKKAAESLGFETKAIKADMSLFDDYKEIPYPFIAHVEKMDDGELIEHYYVVYKATKLYIYIADPDPDVKKRKMSYKQFSKEWTGVALFFAPSPEFKPNTDKQAGFKSFFPIIFKQKGLVTNIVVASLIVTLISIAGSYFLQILIDDYIPNGMFTTLSIMAVGLITAYVFQQIMSYVQQYLLIVLGQRLSIDLILSYVKHLFELPMNFFYTRRVGEITSRFNDANTIIEAVASSILSMLLDVGIVLIMAVVLFAYNADMFLISVLAIPIYAIVMYLFAKPFHQYNMDEMKSGASLESSIIESLNGMETIKALGAEENSYDKVDKDYVHFLKRSFKTARLTSIQEAIKDGLKLIFEVLVLWYGANLVMQNKLSVGQLMAFNALLGYFTDPLQSIIDLQSKIQSAIVAAHRLNEVFEVPSEFKNDGQTTLPIKVDTDITIAFTDVSFEYQYNKPVLDGLSLTITNHEKLALVGVSGSGKSTLAKLLVRFYDLANDNGKITLNNTNIQNIDKQKLREIITYVPQEPHIFTGKVIDNLLLGAKSGTTFDDVLKATEIAEIRTDIEKLSQGFETEISESGSLSGGQRQRISLARALLTDSPILILDESTSNLDLLTEKNVVDNLMELSDKTIVFVAHRLTIAERVPRLVMLENGKIVADGAHDQLLGNNAAYTNLVQK